MPESASWEEQGDNGEWAGRLELGGEGGGVEAGLPASVIRARAAQSAREPRGKSSPSGAATSLRPGRRLVMVVDPPRWYAGFSGALAVVHAVGQDAVYVRFHSGPLESYPPGKFQEYFRPLA